MTSIAKLKDKARKHEQKEDWQAAIEVYQKVLETQQEEEELDLELTLYNRVGDLHLRLGQTDEAVSYYETAADRYAESGFTNNAIALCNKALRHRPDRPAIYLKLSRLCNEQGFHTDARRWILEYVEREVAAGAVEAALTGLEEFADLSNDAEVREVLARQLAAHERQSEAIDQLRLAYAMRLQAGESARAAEIAEQARDVDPGVDLESETPVAVPAAEPAAEPGGEPGELVEAPAGAEDEAAAEAAEEPAEAMGDLETRPEAPAVADADVGGLEGFETTRTTDADQVEADAVSGLEPGPSEVEAASPDEAEADMLGGLETFAAGAGPDEAGDADEAAAVADEEDEEDEEGEPLPLLDTGYEDVPEDEAEPLPGLDDEDVEAEVAAGAGAEAPMDFGGGFEATDEAEEAEAADVDAGGLDLGLPDADEEAVAEPAADEAASAPAGDGAMDVDFGSFDLGFETSEAEAPPADAEDVDIPAVLERARELVSRGLMGEALRELRLLSGTHAPPDVFQQALAVVNEVIRHDENDVAALQRRVEYAARLEDGELLVDAYLDLAEALSRLGTETRARVMYERVLDLDPSNEAARAALGEAEEEEDDVVDLDAILSEIEPEAAAAAPTDGAERETDPDFAAMLSQFKAKVTENVQADDAGDHYDLGLAFKEMGLVDEAIAEFQTALTGGEERLKVYEELGQCFVQKRQYNVALKVFNRALKVPHADESDLLGVYYHMGQCHEELGQRQEAREAYEKVLNIDESFADVPDRMARL